MLKITQTLLIERRLEAAYACGNKRIAVEVSRRVISYHMNSSVQRSVQARLTASRHIAPDWQTVADS